MKIGIYLGQLHCDGRNDSMTLVTNSPKYRAFE